MRKPTQIGFIPKKKEKKLKKTEIMEILKAKGIEFDEKASVEELRTLLATE